MPERGISRTPRISTRARPATTAATASPIPPHTLWSSTVTMARVSPAARIRVSTSIGFTEYRSMTRTAMPSAFSFSYADSASCRVTPAATTVTASLSLERRVLDPPTGNGSSLAYRTGVFGREVRI